MKKIVVFASVILMFLFIIQIANAVGLSASPTHITIVKGIRGQEYDSLVTIQNPNDYEETYLLSVSGEMADWASFYPLENKSQRITQILVPAKSPGRVVTVFKIPEDTPNGDYSSTVYIQGIPTEVTGGNTTALTIRIPIEVLLEVTGTQIISGKVISISIGDTEINRLARIKIDFQNMGNVVVDPTIQVLISKNGTEIDNLVDDNTVVKPGNIETLELEWDTSGQTIGDYAANVKVILDGNTIEEKDVSFKILERGSLTAEGIIEEVVANNEVISGQTAKIEAKFQNTGEIDLVARISGEVYLDNNLVDVLEGDETLIKIGEAEKLTAYFKPTQNGAYLVKANVVYEGKKQELNDILINVIKSNVSDMLFFESQNFIILIIVILFLVIVGIVYKKFKKRKTLKKT